MHICMSFLQIPHLHGAQHFLTPKRKLFFNSFSRNFLKYAANISYTHVNSGAGWEFRGDEISFLLIQGLWVLLGSFGKHVSWERCFSEDPGRRSPSNSWLSKKLLIRP